MGREGGNWNTQEMRGLYGTRVWKGTLQANDLVIGCERFEVGGGTRVFLRHDMWCGEGALNITFPTPTI